MKTLGLLKQLAIRLSLMAMLILPLTAGLTTPALADDGGGRGAVYTITNSASGNEVVVFSRASDGSLSKKDTVATGGLGSGASLGSQGSVMLTRNGHRLFVVNAGSNELSVFTVRKNGLHLTDTANSGGVMPISVAVRGNLVYVLNAGGSGNISGFRVRHNGTLAALDGSTQPLSNGGTGASPMPAQVSFNPQRNQLVVTEKATNLIDTYQLSKGIPSAPVTHPSVGNTPFGFAFTNHNQLIVSEAFPNVPGGSAVSSYKVGTDSIDVISASVSTTQSAACWVVLSKNGKYAFDTNAASGSISSFRIDKHGALTLLEARAGVTGDGSSPIDMAVSRNGNFLYALEVGTGAMHIFRLHSDGSLEDKGKESVPAGSFGLAAE